LTPEQQKERAKDFVRAMDRGDAVALGDLIAPGFIFELTAASPGIPQTMDRKTILEFMPGMVKQMMPNGFNFQFVTVISEGPHVAIQGTGDAIAGNGRRYANKYHWYFCFDGDKIDRFAEYLDSHLAHQTFTP
jgi:ketosteroid isomerase-like protein